MHFVLQNSGIHLPCAMRNSTGIPIMIAQPASLLGRGGGDLYFLRYMHMRLKIENYVSLLWKV